MATLYAVRKRAEGDEYDDDPRPIVVASFDKSKCEEYIARREKEYEAALKLFEKVERWNERYVAKNPQPPLESYKDIVKWKAGDQGTPAIRAEREETKMLNAAIERRNGDKMAAWVAAKAAALEAYLTKLGVPAETQQDGIDYPSWVDYSIVEVEFLE